MAPGPAERRPAWLIWGGAGEGQERQSLVGGVYRIGRDPAAEIHFSTAAVSKQHAVLERRGRRWLLRDLGSTNGLWWRGRRVQELLLVAGDRVALAPGDGDAPWLQFETATPQPLHWLGRGSSGLLAVAAAGGLALLGLALLQVPIRGDLSSVHGPLVLYDRLNRPMRAAESSQHQENRDLDGYPAVLVQALLSSEDSRFWWHPDRKSVV